MNAKFNFAPYVLLVLGAFFAARPTPAADSDEFKVKREAVYEFTQKPVITRAGDNVTITFESKGLCDATVAVEDAQGRIVCHLVSGVLGPNAPEPFQKNSKKQVIVWDGKDDRGVYVDDKTAMTVRVSLGLKPRFERTLFWSPHKRISDPAPLLASTPEGVYEFEGLGVDHLRLFDHAGNYVRTVYPFPAGKIPNVEGLQKRAFLPDGVELPKKLSFEEASLLTSGSSAWGTEGGHAGGYAATAMAVYPETGNLAKIGKRRIALVFHRLNRLTSDGDSGELPILGPSVCFKVQVGSSERIVAPTSAAFSPDGRRLYLTGYVWKMGTYNRESQCYHMVMVMDYEKQDEPRVFLGAKKTDDGHGSGNDQFCVPLSVACDAQGRVYVADHVNNRIQVFSPDGKYLKTIPTPYPSVVKVNPTTGEIWSFSWEVIGPSFEIQKASNYPREFKPSVACLGTFDNPKKADPQPLSGVEGTGSGGWVGTGGQAIQAAVDFFAGEPAIWTVGRKASVSVAEANWSGRGGLVGGWMSRGIRILRNESGQWKPVYDFAKTAAQTVRRVEPPQFSRSRLYVNPTDGMLYVCDEQTGPGKSFYTVIRIDPETGKVKEVNLPFDAEDMVFDNEGLAYLKTDREVVRLDPGTWREVPWDYGEERPSVRFSGSGSVPAIHSVAALALPGERPGWFHASGMWVSPRRHLAVICNIPYKKPEANPKDRYAQRGITRKYTPLIYPGRGGGHVISIFDAQGKVLAEDAVPGMTNADGIGIDRDDNLYVMVAASRMIDGKAYPSDKSETLMKFRPGKAKLTCDGKDAILPLPPELKPNRPPEVSKYGMANIWVDGAEWMYGGVGYGGQGGSCTCWHSRFQLDEYARSFVPEVQRYSVAVLDTNGNLIMHIGRYGNVDDGQPLIPQGGPEQTRSIGGDEVALAHAAYVGVHTDRRLFIHDAGNGRILGVRLDYAANESVPLKDVVDLAEKK